MWEANRQSNGRLEYNRLLMLGYSSFQNKEIPQALSYYSDAFQFDP